MQVTYFGDSPRQAALNRLKDILGPPKQGQQIDIYPNSIFCEQVMTNGKNGYIFPITQKNMDTSTLPLQQGLIESDFFMMYEAAIYVSKRAIAKPGSVLFYQFGNPDVFTGSTAGTATDIETFYCAKLSLKVSTTNKINTWLTQEFLKVPFASANVVAAPISTVGGAATAPNTNNYARDAKFVSTGGTVLLGSNDNNFQLDLTIGTTAPNVADTAGTNINVVSIQCNGFRIPQGTNAYEAVQQYVASYGTSF